MTQFSEVPLDGRYFYVLRYHDDWAVKIGITTRPRNRIKALSRCTSHTMDHNFRARPPRPCVFEWFLPCDSHETQRRIEYVVRYVCNWAFGRKLGEGLHSEFFPSLPPEIAEFLGGYWTLDKQSAKDIERRFGIRIPKPKKTLKAPLRVVPIPLQSPSVG